MRIKYIEYHYSRQMTVRMSVLNVGSALSPRQIPGANFFQRLSKPQSHSAAEELHKLKTSDDMGNMKPRPSGS
jgi:hypothetical protein